MLSIARTLILPAAIEHQRRVANAVVSTESAGVDASGLRESLELISDGVHALEQKIAALDEVFSFTQLEPLEACYHIRDHVLSAMEELRAAADFLETRVDQNLWPLPSYSQLLTMR